MRASAKPLTNEEQSDDNTTDGDDPLAPPLPRLVVEHQSLCRMTRPLGEGLRRGLGLELREIVCQPLPGSFDLRLDVLGGPGLLRLALGHSLPPRVRPAAYAVTVAGSNPKGSSRR